MMWKVILIDNYGRDSVADILVVDGLSEIEATAKADEINSKGDHASSYWARAVHESTVLSRGMADLV